ncbi:hypothetical protein BGX21_003870 [Mortierella sp. AD011]|nr:hypothetical protein BGX20_008623 [Mortierella sp. AD010]KAF9400607.1 hypothetical protein BGX21_003870 [Mortierella sp. AD011]
MIHPLELHEIRSCIGSFLSSSDLLNCACVSKEWNSTFSDLIWRHITLDNSSSSRRRPLPTVGQVHAHSGLIHALTLKNQLPNEYYLVDNLYRLYSLQVNYRLSCRTRPILPLLSNLIEAHSSSLKQFQFDGWNNIISVQTFNAVGTCQGLTSLWLSNVILPSTAFKALLDACANIGKVAEEEDGDSIYLISRKKPGGLAELRLEDLSIRDFNAEIFATQTPLSHVEQIHIQEIYGMEPNAQLQLLVLCPNIRSLYWRGILFKVKFQVHQWVYYIEAGMWPLLTCLDVLGEEFYDEALSRVISRLPLSLEKLLVRATGFGRMAFNSLISAERHYNHIRELELFACSDVTSSMIQQIMVKMPALESFSANRLCVTDILGTPSETNRNDGDVGDNGRHHGSGQEWVCKNLRTLRLCIDMGVASDPTTLEYNERQRQVHLRLSTLQSLEILELSRNLPYRAGIVKVRKLDHKMNTGLRHLASLKRIRKFLFRPGQSLTTEEIEWMTDTWKSLSTVSRNMNLDQDINDKLVASLAQHGIAVV